MKAKELCEYLETILTRPGSRDADELDIVIKTSERCLSCDGISGIKSVEKGFDWHKNEIILFPEKELVPKSIHRDIPKKPNGNLCSECEEYLEKEWEYCPTCGKAIER